MVAAAVGAGSRWGILGAVLFLASDSVLAWDKFVRPLAHGHLVVMITYHLAQTALVVSLVG
jgi:alkenylglycerophosphocholine hydrolase